MSSSTKAKRNRCAEVSHFIVVLHRIAILGATTLLLNHLCTVRNSLASGRLAPLLLLGIDLLWDIDHHELHAQQGDDATLGTISLSLHQRGRRIRVTYLLLIVALLLIVPSLFRLSVIHSQSLVIHSQSLGRGPSSAPLTGARLLLGWAGTLESVPAGARAVMAYRSGPGKAVPDSAVDPALRAREAGWRR